MIQFGKYDQKVTFQTFQDIDDGYGGSTPVFTDVLTTFANISQLRASSNIEQSRIQLEKTYLIKIQYRSNFEPTVKNVINYRGKRFTITSVVLNKERLSREWFINAVAE